MSGLSKFLQPFPAAVATLIGATSAASLAIAALLGDFSRPAIATLMLLAGAIFLLVGAVISGGMPMLGSIPGTEQGLNYTNTLNTEMLLQQSLQHEPELVRAAKRRRRIGVRLLASGALLVVLGLVIA